MSSAESLGLSRWSAAILLAYGAVVLACGIWTQRPLSAHEAVLPQTSRVMFADGDWLVPKVGVVASKGTTSQSELPVIPWLENPPLPQWITVAIASLFGRCDTVWITRIGPALVSALTVLLVAWTAARWFGDSAGLLSGLVLCTTYQFTRYAWLAEDEIYLTAVITLAVISFAYVEFFADNPEGTASIREPLRMLFGPRPWSVLAVFAALGLTNWVKGLIFGTVLAGIPMFVFIVGSRSVNRLTKYLWVWGFVVYAAFFLAWPLALAQRYPDAFALWNYDLFGRLSGNYTEINQPVWYYAVNLVWMIAPWTCVLPWTIAATWKKAWNEPLSAERFLWGWALSVPLVLSIPGGKHHHYLLHALVPWAVLTARGLPRLRETLLAWPRFVKNPWSTVALLGLPLAIGWILLSHKLQWSPLASATGAVAIGLLSYLWAFGVYHAEARRSAGIVFGILAIGFVFGNWFAGQAIDKYRNDYVFYQQVERELRSADLPVLVDHEAGGFESMMCLFYLPDGPQTLPNLTFLKADAIRASEVHVVTSESNLSNLRTLGEVTQIATNPRALVDQFGERRMALFRLKFGSIDRLSASSFRITPLQSMGRANRPELGERL